VLSGTIPNCVEINVTDTNYRQFSVAVVGGGPAGLFAARELAQAGAQVALLNRDIKAGGLAEYGIYPNKLKMKDGLRKQFRQTLDIPNLHYFGNLSIGLDHELSLPELHSLGFDAVVVTVGAQGTKWLGLPGEDLKGVYHAKDLVYHYNNLPPYSERKFDIGKRVILVGVGNVMLDIAHWTIRDLKVNEVIAIARRGPADVKFSKKEMEIVARNLDLADLDAEFARTDGAMRGVGQDVDAAKAFILSALNGAQEPVSQTKFSFEFLVSPKRLVGDAQGRVRAVEVEDTTLVARPEGGSRDVGLGTTRELEADTVVFCIGDRVDESLGLPLDKWGDFAKNPTPHFGVDGISYEAYNPELQQPVEGVFLAGWAREASSGLVGAARKDGTNAAKAVLSYLDAAQPKNANAVTALNSRIAMSDKPVVRAADLKKLEAVEVAHAAELNVPEFKYASNDEMLAAMGLAGVKEAS
jgi:ferredoxin--NADP+ reductase